MAEDKTYNGWTNYETWAVKLWIDNEEGSSNFWVEEAQQIFKDSRSRINPTFTKAESAALELSERLKSSHEEASPEVTGIYADLLSAALSEVNWHEIASALIEDNCEEDKEDKEDEEAT